MKQTLSFLHNLKDDVFKLIPMKEDEIYSGVTNYTGEYIENLLVNLKGASITFPELSLEKQYISVINNVNYLKKFNLEFQRWRTVVFNSIKSIKTLIKLYGGKDCGE